MAGSDTCTRGLFPRFDRRFLRNGSTVSQIGSGALGGKAAGLAYIKAEILPRLQGLCPPGISITVPSLAVIATDVFDAFISRNHLTEVAESDLPDDRIALAFQQAELPVEVLGDLEALVEKTHVPLAIRSSSLLEDALAHPFAGAYATKMIPNNQLMAEDRFRALIEAIKFVYASTFFSVAKMYRAGIGIAEGSEKMAVIVQEVVGERHGQRFYPEISGVGRSHNYYPMIGSKPENGIVDLALGLGKTIVDGGVCWSYDPSRPAAPPPAGSPHAVLVDSQTDFWAIDMGAVSYDPVRETEYISRFPLTAAEADDTLHYVASTYDAESDRMCAGVGRRGPRVIDFAPLLVLDLLPLNACIRSMLSAAKEIMGEEVEIEFAATLGTPPKPAARIGFLQVRPMAGPGAAVSVEPEELLRDDVLVASECSLGNGINEELRDVVYLKPECFDPGKTQQIAAEVAAFNRSLVGHGAAYVLIGFGRWGSSDPWLGIPVEWGQISGAKVIVEAALTCMKPELSQGSHFFHNLIGCKVLYLSVPHDGPEIDWDWFTRQVTIDETDYVRHVRTAVPLLVKVDGTSRRGVIISRG